MSGSSMKKARQAASEQEAGAKPDAGLDSRGDTENRTEKLHQDKGSSSGADRRKAGAAFPSSKA